MGHPRVSLFATISGRDGPPADSRVQYNLDGMKTVLYSVLLLLFAVVIIPAAASDRLNPELLKSVLRIETAPDVRGNFEIGTGFLISTTGDESRKILLVTNKHMIGDWNCADRSISTF